MANKSLTDIILAARQLANYEVSGFLDDTQELPARVNEAVLAYYDLVLEARETYFQQTFTFALTGGYSGNTQDLTALSPYKIQGLDRNPGSSSVETVPTLPSFRERHRAMQRSYDWNPLLLTVYPPECSAGNYLLWYTPRAPVLAVPTVINMATGPNSVVASTHEWLFVNSAFTAADVGSSIVVTGAANSGNNGTFLITSVLSPGTIQTSAAVGLVNETFATTGVAVSYQPGGTVPTLTDVLQPGALWMELFVAVAILDKAEQDSASLQARLAVQSKRIVDAMRYKQDEPKQVPLARRRGWLQNWRGGWY